ncbi:MAG: putative addiction module antidote protein, partial [Candidatus Doudnabacteria bacterium]|nr:putative addiction module antidote protein [Candidatus Doudnabacteria bacterium]
IGYIAKVKGMTQISKETGLGRESLYKTFQEGSEPKFSTILKVLKAMGLSLRVEALQVLSVPK